MKVLFVKRQTQLPLCYTTEIWVTVQDFLLRAPINVYKCRQIQLAYDLGFSIYLHGTKAFSNMIVR